MKGEYYNTQENFNKLDALRRTEGSFGLAIIDAFFKADGGNRATLVAAFPWLIRS